MSDPTDDIEFDAEGNQTIIDLLRKVIRDLRRFKLMALLSGLALIGVIGLGFLYFDWRASENCRAANAAGEIVSITIERLASPERAAEILAQVPELKPQSC